MLAFNLLADIDFPAQNLRDVESRYDYDVFINPKESPLQVKNYLVNANRMVPFFSII